MITASSPPSSRKRSADSILGPMLPGGNWPSARYLAAWSAEILLRLDSVGMP